MQHAGHFDVGDEIVGAEQFPFDVAARRRGAVDFIFLRILRLGRRLDRKIIADLAIPFDFRVEPATADQFAIAHLFRRCAFRNDDALVDGEIIGGDAQMLGRHVDEQAAGFSARIAQRHAAMRHAG